MSPGFSPVGRPIGRPVRRTTAGAMLPQCEMSYYVSHVAPCQNVQILVELFVYGRI